MRFYPYQPVFLIGAARSGTKILRDVIGQNQAFDRVPYDINYIWRLGNESCLHDELTPEQVNSVTSQKIVQKLEGFWKGAPFLIEKTVSNSLRVPFVECLYPDAKYIFLIRDGRDVVESSYRQWTALPDWKYIWDKACSYPLLDAPGYALTYILALTRRVLFSRSKQLSTWGPRYQGIDFDTKSRNLIEVCAIQWVRSVEKALKSFQEMDKNRVFEVRYEEFVQKPGVILDKLSVFLGTPLNVDSCGDVTNVNIGKGWSKLNLVQQERVLPLMQNTLDLLGYR